MPRRVAKAIASRSCASRPCPACGSPPCSTSQRSSTGKVPATLNVIGHDRGGKAVAYKQIRCINLAKRGMFALNVEWFAHGPAQGSTGYSHGRMNQLDLCGTSGLAPFYLA